MSRTEGCVFFRERSNTRNFHKLLKSSSNERSKESDNLHPHKTGPICRSKFKTFKEEEDEFDATLRREESLDHNNCIWLSSGGASSPSSCFQDNSLSVYTDLKIDAWLISLLSTPSTKSGNIISTKLTFFDGSRVNPIEEASLVLDQIKFLEENLVFHENLEEKDVVTWLSTESSSISSITDSSDDYSFSSCCSSDYSSEVVDLDEIGTEKPLFWSSEWTSDWDSDTKEDLFIMSPRKDTYNRRLLFDTHPKSSTNFDPKNTNDINGVKRIRNKTSRFRKPTKTSSKIVPLDNEADFVGPTDTRTITPVFWPSSCESEWDSDAKLDLFVMSPRKDIYSFGKSPKTSPDTLRLRVLNGKMDSEKGCGRRLEFSSCIKTAAIGANDDTTELGEVKPLTMKSVSKHKIVLEDLLLVDKLNLHGAIEEVLGLDEFDGHHGLESEFNKEEFSLVEIF